MHNFPYQNLPTEANKADNGALSALSLGYRADAMDLLCSASPETQLGIGDCAN